MIKRGLKSWSWILLYLTTYIALQIGYSIIATSVIGLELKLSGQIVNIEEIMDNVIRNQIPQSIIFAGIASTAIYLLVMRLRNKSISEECRFSDISWNHGVASGILGISGLAVSSILLATLSFFQDTAYLEHIENMELLLGGNKLLVFISVGIVAPIIEEIIFRGLVFRELEKSLNVKAVVVVQALLFGIYHFNLAQGVYTVFLGLVLGLALVWTKSIWAPIIIHMVNNSVSFLFSFIDIENDILMMIVGWILLIGVIIFPMILVYLYKTRVVSEYTG